MKINVKLMADNVPGKVKRYALQEVSSSPALPICVTVDGVCNHADTDTQEVPAFWDPSESMVEMVCTKCGAVVEAE